jgi:hypothetical protein
VLAVEIGTAALPVELRSRATHERSGTRSRTSISTFRAWRPPGWTIPECMCFTNLVVYATRLPFGPGSIARPTWRGFGARRSRVVRKRASKSRSSISARFFVPKHGGTFLSQVGPHSRLALSQLSIFLSCDVLSSPETTRATPWVALAWSCYAASFLARAPLREGGSETGPATRDDGVVPARHRGGRGRFGELRCVDGLQHGLHGLSPGRRIDQTADVRKGSNEKSNKLLRNRRSELLLDCTSLRSARGVRSRHGGGRWPRD